MLFICQLLTKRYVYYLLLYGTSSTSVRVWQEFLIELSVKAKTTCFLLKLALLLFLILLFLILVAKTRSLS